MNTINYDALFQETVKNLTGKPRLFLHSCCAPCSTKCLEELFPHFDVTVVYYNPNIDADDEYELRLKEQKRYINEVYGDKIRIIDDGHRAEDFEKIAAGREDCPEGGERCFACYRLRLSYAASFCGGNDYFGTTLTVSPLKNSQKINEIGFDIEKSTGKKYLPSDFKKREGYKRSIELSRQYGLYRQNYCGCRFSKNKGEKQ